LTFRQIGFSLPAAIYSVDIQLRRSWTLPTEPDDFTREKWFHHRNFGIRAKATDKLLPEDAAMHERRSSVLLFFGAGVPAYLASYASQHSNIGWLQLRSPQQTPQREHHVLGVFGVQESYLEQRFFQLDVHAFNLFQ
jgi:hypothetical protein